MKKVVKLLSVLLLVSSVVCVVFISCKKDKDTNSNGVLNLTAINNNTSQVVNVKLKSMEKKTFSIGCRVYTSRTFDVKNKIFGYLDCNKNYCLIDIEKGSKIKQIPLPEFISMVVIDTIRNVIIGYYNVKVDTSSDSDRSNHVLAFNLSDGTIISDKQYSVGSVWNATVFFFRDIENEYVLTKHVEETDCSELVFINPYTGDIIRTLNIGIAIGNGVYDRVNNRLIGVTFLKGEIGERYIVSVDLNTGNILSKVVAQGLDSYYADEMDYDAETNSYILLSANNEVLFFDVETGKINERYQLDFDIVSLKVWRSSK